VLCGRLKWYNLTFINDTFFLDNKAYLFRLSYKKGTYCHYHLSPLFIIVILTALFISLQAKPILAQNWVINGHEIADYNHCAQWRSHNRKGWESCKITVSRIFGVLALELGRAREVLQKWYWGRHCSLSRFSAHVYGANSKFQSMEVFTTDLVTII